MELNWAGIDYLVFSESVTFSPEGVDGQASYENWLSDFNP
ncbi:hypothetical protein BC643_4262 [Mangrovibacterium diazotrophicum]|uniref:Uncharacterized protein n=1 Tax=Mangrovibacterium diazotrophicum TaxID=1261403 RepID=A0A419VV57_9BACT|nr:hypothetical protein BC643_4262 [Mangrovibacterium diazotrophicum]